MDQEVGGHLAANFSVASLFLRRHRNAHNFPVVACIAAAIGKCGMRPDHTPSRHRIGGLENIGPADFLVFLWRQASNDQIASLVEEENPVPLGNQKGVAPAERFTHNWFVSLPNAFAGVGFDAAQFAVAAHAIDMAVFDERSVHDTMESVGALGFFAAA